MQLIALLVHVDFDMSDGTFFLSRKKMLKTMLYMYHGSWFLGMLAQQLFRGCRHCSATWFPASWFWRIIFLTSLGGGGGAAMKKSETCLPEVRCHALACLVFEITACLSIMACFVLIRHACTTSVKTSTILYADRTITEENSHMPVLQLYAEILPYVQACHMVLNKNGRTTYSWLRKKWPSLCFCVHSRCFSMCKRKGDTTYLKGRNQSRNETKLTTFEAAYYRSVTF
jgi:hypothetical protein